MTRPALTPEHPLWEELLELRSRGFFYHDLAKIATGKGYPLTTPQVKGGFRRVPRALGLPVRGSRFLMEKYAADEGRIDVMKMLDYVLREMNEKYHSLLVELEGADTPLRRATLELQVDVALHSIASCSIQIRKLQLAAHEQTGVDVGAVSVMVGGQNVVLLTPGDFTNVVDEVVGLVRERLQAATPEAAALEQFGCENVHEVTEDEREEDDEL
jgi:hypothetical protein